MHLPVCTLIILFFLTVLLFEEKYLSDLERLWRNIYITVGDSPQTIFDANSNFLVQNYKAGNINDIITRKFFADSPLIGSYLLILVYNGHNTGNNKILEISAITFFGKVSKLKKSFFLFFFLALIAFSV